MELPTYSINSLMILGPTLMLFWNEGDESWGTKPRTPLYIHKSPPTISCLMKKLLNLEDVLYARLIVNVTNRASLELQYRITVSAAFYETSQKARIQFQIDHA